MSTSLWRWTEACDGAPCVGDCDLCSRNMDDEDIDEEVRISQCNEIVRYMTLHGGITQAEAFNQLNVGRLSARIYDLRHRDGYAITTQNVSKKNSKGRTTRFARYVFTNGIHTPTPPKRETPEAFRGMEQAINDFFDSINNIMKGASKK